MTSLNTMGSYVPAAGVEDPGRSVTFCYELLDEAPLPCPDANVMMGIHAFERSDITEGKPGIPLTLSLTMVDGANGRMPIRGANVEIWHCDADGIYSAYATNMNARSTGTTYLRGVQTTDRRGRVTFRTIYPGWSNLRATHVNILIYNGTTLKKTLQLGFPHATNAAVYATDLYIKGQSPTTNNVDQVFGNAAGNGTYGGRREFQIAAVSGDNAGGYIATLPIAIARFA